MRAFTCFYYKMREDGVLIRNTNNACWAGLSSSNRTWFIPEKKFPSGEMFYESGSNIKFDKNNKDYIFIDKWKEDDQSMKNIRRLLSIIDKISDCKIVKIEDKEYIKYKCIPNHYANLTLLNFIRKCWFKPRSFNYEQFFKDIFKDMRGKEPLVFLMTCLRDNVLPDTYGYGDHSNVYSNIKPKSKERLLSYIGNSMESFLKSR